MTPIQQLMLGAGSAKKTYLDDVFSTYVYTGNSGSQTVNTGLDMSGEGGMVWVKNRDNNNTQHSLFDTLRGVNNVLHSESSSAQASYNYNQTFTSTGFTFNNNFGDTNGNTNKYASWNFRRSPGFFEVITWTGNNQTNHQISHSLGCAPGFMIIKRVSGSEDWTCLHRDMPINSWIDFNQTTAGGTGYSGLWDDVRPTATHINVGQNGRVNGNGDTYVGYLFAGGESTAATANSTVFTGSVYLTIPSSAAGNLSPGTGDFCIEAWIKPDDWQDTDGFYWVDGNGPAFQYTSSNSKLNFKTGGTNNTILLSATAPELGQWTHVAVTRSGSALKMFFNGIEVHSVTNSDNISGSNTTYIGYGLSGFDGDMSNLRFVKGSAVYTTSFRPPTEPLTNISGTELLMCNSSSNAKGSTVTPATISSSGGVNPSADSPFDDPAGFVFGEDGKQNLVKTGSYIGNNSSDGPKVYLGWEPGFLIVRRFSGGTGDWKIFDNMRGLSGNGLTDAFLESNTTDAEQSNLNCVDISSTGFELKSSDTNWNASNDKYIYIAIRRNDGYVGKPPDAGTGVFTMDTGASSSTTPNFDSGFPVDFTFSRPPLLTSNWFTGSRLTNQEFMYLNNNDASSDSNAWSWDSNVGWQQGGSNWTSSYQSYMWKRHAGMDVVTTYGGSGKYVPHSLGLVPEMMILKARNNAQDWRVFHKGVNGGVNPEQYGMVLNSTAGQNQNIGHWHNTAPTATHFRTGTWDSGGANTSYRYLICLFASVDGISKVGYYTGDGATGRQVTTGFQPRFILIKRIDGTGDWLLCDSIRGVDKNLYLNSNATSSGGQRMGTNSTAFWITALGVSSINANNEEYIYYCHA